MVGSGRRNARAISPVESPPTRRRVSATWLSGASAGWQQVKIRRRRSSAITAGSSSGGGSIARAVGLAGEGLDLAVDSPAAAEVVARAVARHRHQPGAGIVGQPVDGPVDQRRRQRLLHRLLGGVEIAEHARHRGDEPAVLAPEDVLDEVSGAAEGRRYISQTGRTSMKPSSRRGSLEAHSTASALEAQSIK